MVRDVRMRCTWPSLAPHLLCVTRHDDLYGWTVCVCGVATMVCAGVSPSPQAILEYATRSNIVDDDDAAGGSGGQPGGFAAAMGSLHNTLMSETGLGSAAADTLWGATTGSRDAELEATRDRVENCFEARAGKFVFKVCAGVGASGGAVRCTHARASSPPCPALAALYS